MRTLQKMNVRGAWKVEQFRNGVKIGELNFANAICTVGMNYLLNAGFHDGTKVATWYIGLIDSSGYTAVSVDDTMAAQGHNGWNEFTSYNEATRVEWAEGAASARSITNSTAATFNITGSGTVKGLFLVSDSTRSGTDGTLWSTALFTSPVPVQNGDQLKATYTLTG